MQIKQLKDEKINIRFELEILFLSILTMNFGS